MLMSSHEDDDDDDDNVSGLYFSHGVVGAHRVMIFREVDRKNENSSKCLGPLYRGYAEARYELLLQRLTEEEGFCLREVPGIFSQWRFYELFMGSFFPAKHAAES